MREVYKRAAKRISGSLYAACHLVLHTSLRFTTLVFHTYSTMFPNSPQGMEGSNASEWETIRKASHLMMAAPLYQSVPLQRLRYIHRNQNRRSYFIMTPLYERVPRVHLVSILPVWKGASSDVYSSLFPNAVSTVLIAFLACNL